MSNIYFISDIHLGVPDYEATRVRERKLLQWLDEIKVDAEAIYIVGDLFDFWFEYNKAVPKGYVRVLGKLAEISDAGIPIHFFTGNHDLWMFGYFEQELNITVYKQPIQVELGEKKFYIGHGDGLGPGDHGYKFIKKVFANPFFQWLYKWVHPDIGIGIASYFSRRSRYANGEVLEEFKGEENEWLVQHCKEELKTQHFDYFVFGHRHLPLDLEVGKGSRYINLGDWLNYYTYAVFDGKTLELKEYKPA